MPSNNSRNANEAGKVNTHIPPVSALSSTSEARTWIRSVSYPEKNGNSSVHWDNEFEPLITTRQVPLDACVFVIELSVPFYVFCLACYSILFRLSLFVWRL